MKTLPSCQFDNEKLILDMQLSIPCEVDAIEPVIHRVMGSIREMNCVPESEFEVEDYQDSLSMPTIVGFSELLRMKTSTFFFHSGCVALWVLI